MPTITKLSDLRPPRPPRRKHKQTKNEAYDIRRSVYNTRRWRNLRLHYLEANPLCEVCLALKEQKIEPAIDVHHLKTFTGQEDANERAALAYDATNLATLCKHHHWAVHHNGMKIKRLDNGQLEITQEERKPIDLWALD